MRIGRVKDTAIARYTMGNISGTTIIDETRNYNGTLVNGPTLVPGYIGNALDFDPASEQYVDCGTALGNYLGNGVDQLSMSIWINLDNVVRNSGIFYAGTLIDDHGVIEINAAGIDFIRVRLNQQDFDNAVGFPYVGQWSHLVFVYTGESVKLYINNIIKINELYSTDFNLNGIKTAIGIYYAISSAYTFDGKIDQVYIFDRALQPWEVNELFQEKSTIYPFRNGETAL
jgi:hypothetical protein